MRKEVEESEADERNLDIKIKKKQEELERTEKRLKSLENVRPQFMDEVDKLEKVHSLTHSLTHLLTHSLTHLLIYLLRNYNEYMIFIWRNIVI
jgi:predicted nuclease with TOPRIM domain